MFYYHPIFDTGGHHINLVIEYSKQNWTVIGGTGVGGFPFTKEGGELGIFIDPNVAGLSGYLKKYGSYVGGTKVPAPGDPNQFASDIVDIAKRYESKKNWATYSPFGNYGRYNSNSLVYTIVRRAGLEFPPRPLFTSPAWEKTVPGVG